MKYRGQTIRVVTAEIERDGNYLIAQRPEKGILPGLWEFPGGRVRLGEPDAEALRRKIAESFNLEVEVGELLLEVDHPYEHYAVQLRHYRCHIGDQEVRCAEDRAVAWVAPEEFGDYQFPNADEKTVGLLLSEGADE
jgi:mutator protein MutT